MGTTHTALATRAGRPALLFLFALAVACAVAFASGATAAAKGASGPGPFDNITIDGGDLVLRIPGSDPTAVRLSGNVTLSAAGADAEWVPFDRRPDVENGGARLVARGTVGGVPIDEYFADGDQRRLLVRNGDGRTTELDVYRFRGALLITHANQRPEAPVKSTAVVFERELDALTDGSTTVQLPASPAVGIDVVVAASLPDLPQYAIDRTILLTATDASGERSSTVSAFDVTRVAFVHFVLPEGTYTLSARVTDQYGDIFGGTASATSVLDAIASLDVARDRRTFVVTLPPSQTSTIEEVDVVVDNLAALAPTFGSRVGLTVRLLSSDGLVSASTTRDVGDPEPLTVRLPAFPGEYTVFVDVGRSSSDPNGVSTSLGIRLDGQRLPGAVRVAIPPLVSVSGTLRDPGFVLASAPDPFTGVRPVHNVIFEATTADGAVAASASASLRGFARSYAVLVPAGSTVSASGSVTASIGRPRSEPDSYENDAVGLQLEPVDGVACDDGCTIDLAVPALPDRVTVSGRVVDAKGKPARVASVSAYSNDLESLGGVSVVAYVITDPKGRFTLRLPRAASYRLSVSTR